MVPPFISSGEEAGEEHGPTASWLRQGPGWGQPVRWRSDQPSLGSAPTFRAPTFGFVFVPSPEGYRFRRATARGSTGPIFPRIPAPRQGSGRIVSSPTFKLSVHAWTKRTEPDRPRTRRRGRPVLWRRRLHSLLRRLPPPSSAPASPDAAGLRAWIAPVLANQLPGSAAAVPEGARSLPAEVRSPCTRARWQFSGARAVPRAADQQRSLLVQFLAAAG